MSRCSALSLACCLLFSGLCFAAEPKTAAEETVFFSFDDHSIPWHHNLKLTPVTAEKHANNPVLRRGPAGAPDHGHAILYGSVLKIDGKFRMWYLGMFETEIKSGQAPGWWRPMCYAESDDGIIWTKPELGLVEFNGNKRNNICLIESEVPSLAKVNDFLSVLYEPNDPNPSQRYKCAYIAHPTFDNVRGGRSTVGPDEKRWAAMICATSADGITWNVVSDRPMNAGGERFEVSSLYHFNKFYYASGQLLSPWANRLDGSPTGRVMLTYRSADFKSWSKAKAMSFARPGQLASTPIQGQQTHMGAGMWDRGNVMIGLYGMWQDAEKKPTDGRYWNQGVAVDLGLIVSNNGVHFREPVPDHKTIARGTQEEWDSIALLQGHAFVNEGDKTMMWYSHWDTGGKLRNMEIGLATLRRDGFAYLSRHDAGGPGHFVTTLVESPHQKQSIHLNVDGVSSSEPIVVELVDERDQPISGHSGKDAATVTSGGTRQTVSWPGSQTKTGLPNVPFAIRVRFPDNDTARVYAVYAD